MGERQMLWWLALLILTMPLLDQLNNAGSIALGLAAVVPPWFFLFWMLRQLVEL